MVSTDSEAATRVEPASKWPTATGSRPTAATALERSDLPRMRAFHTFGITAAVGAIGLTLAIGGDPLARLLFWIGAGILSLANVVLLFMTKTEERYRSNLVGAMWIVATVSVLTALYYFGPFSGVVIAPMIGVVFISLDRNVRVSAAVAAILIVGHLVLALLIITGVVVDRGVLSSIVAGRTQLVFAELLIVGFLVAGFLLGRWARETNARAFAELEGALRVIGDQQQALADADVDAQRARAANEGRWTNQVMGEWRLGLVIGRGAMGEVYDAVSEDGRAAAVKLLDARAAGSPSLVERFHREMAVAAKLDSPHIVKVFSISPVDAVVPYFAMERLRGADLATRLRKEPRLPIDELAVLIDHVARALEVARLAGVVHRDLKPHNLVLHEGATWKVLDFGVSKLMDSEGTLTGEGIVGTPQYMAPEQASGGNVTPLADVYALGAIAYRCLTGRSPFKGSDLAEVVYQVVHTPPMRPSLLGRMPRGIDDVLAVAMAKDPRRRFSSAMSFAQAFVTLRRARPLVLDAPLDAWVG